MIRSVNLSEASIIEIIPDFFELHMTGRAQALVNKFMICESASEASHLLDIISKIVDDQWREDYQDIFVCPEVIKKLSSLLDINDKGLKILIVEVFTNLLFRIDKLNSTLSEQIITSGFFMSIIDVLSVKETSEEFSLDL